MIMLLPVLERIKGFQGQVKNGGGWDLGPHEKEFRVAMVICDVIIGLSHA